MYFNLKLFWTNPFWKVTKEFSLTSGNRLYIVIFKKNLLLLVLEKNFKFIIVDCIDSLAFYCKFIWFKIEKIESLNRKSY